MNPLAIALPVLTCLSAVLRASALFSGEPAVMEAPAVEKADLAFEHEQFEMKKLASVIPDGGNVTVQGQNITVIRSNGSTSNDNNTVTFAVNSLVTFNNVNYTFSSGGLMDANGTVTQSTGVTWTNSATSQSQLLMTNATVNVLNSSVATTGESQVDLSIGSGPVYVVETVAGSTSFFTTTIGGAMSIPAGAFILVPSLSINVSVLTNSTSGTDHIFNFPNSVGIQFATDTQTPPRWNASNTYNVLTGDTMMLPMSSSQMLVQANTLVASNLGYVTWESGNLSMATTGLLTLATGSDYIFNYGSAEFNATLSAAKAGSTRFPDGTLSIPTNSTMSLHGTVVTTNSPRLMNTSSLYLNSTDRCNMFNTDITVVISNHSYVLNNGSILFNAGSTIILNGNTISFSTPYLMESTTTNINDGDVVNLGGVNVTVYISNGSVLDGSGLTLATGANASIGNCSVSLHEGVTIQTANIPLNPSDIIGFGGNLMTFVSGEASLLDSSGVVQMTAGDTITMGYSTFTLGSNLSLTQAIIPLADGSVVLSAGQNVTVVTASGASIIAGGPIQLQASTSLTFGSWTVVVQSSTQLSNLSIALSAADVATINGNALTIGSGGAVSISRAGIMSVASNARVSFASSLVTFAAAANSTASGFTLLAADTVTYGSTVVSFGATGSQSIVFNGTVISQSGSSVSIGNSTVRTNQVTMFNSSSIPLYDGEVASLSGQNVTIVLSNNSVMGSTGALQMTAQSQVSLGSTVVTFASSYAMSTAVVLLATGDLVTLQGLEMNMSLATGASVQSSGAAIFVSGNAFSVQGTMLTLANNLTQTTGSVGLRANDLLSFGTGSLRIVSTQASLLTNTGMVSFVALSNVTMGTTNVLLSVGVNMTNSSLPLSSTDAIRIAGSLATIETSNGAFVAGDGAVNLVNGTTIVVGKTTAAYTQSASFMEAMEVPIVNGTSMTINFHTITAIQASDDFIDPFGNLSLVSGTVLGAITTNLTLAADVMVVNDSVPLSSGDVANFSTGFLEVVNAAGSFMDFYGILSMVNQSSILSNTTVVRFASTNMISSPIIYLNPLDVATVGNNNITAAGPGASVIATGQMHLDVDASVIVNGTTVTVHQAQTISNATIALTATDQIIIGNGTCYVVTSNGTYLNSAGHVLWQAGSVIQIGLVRVTFSTIYDMTVVRVDLSSNDVVLVEQNDLLIYVSNGSYVDGQGAINIQAGANVSFAGTSVLVASSMSMQTANIPLGANDVVYNGLSVRVLAGGNGSAVQAAGNVLFGPAASAIVLNTTVLYSQVANMTSPLLPTNNGSTVTFSDGNSVTMGLTPGSGIGSAGKLNLVSGAVVNWGNLTSATVNGSHIMSNSSLNLTMGDVVSIAGGPITMLSSGASFVYAPGYIRLAAASQLQISAVRVSMGLGTNMTNSTLSITQGTTLTVDDQPINFVTAAGSTVDSSGAVVLNVGANISYGSLYVGFGTVNFMSSSTIQLGAMDIVTFSSTGNRVVFVTAANSTVDPTNGLTASAGSIFTLNATNVGLATNKILTSANVVLTNGDSVAYSGTNISFVVAQSSSVNFRGQVSLTVNANVSIGQVTLLNTVATTFYPTSIPLQNGAQLTMAGNPFVMVTALNSVLRGDGSVFLDKFANMSMSNTFLYLNASRVMSSTDIALFPGDIALVSNTRMTVATAASSSMLTNGTLDMLSGSALLIGSTRTAFGGETLISTGFIPLSANDVVTISNAAVQIVAVTNVSGATRVLSSGSLFLASGATVNKAGTTITLGSDRTVTTANLALMTNDVVTIQTLSATLVTVGTPIVNATGAAIFAANAVLQFAVARVRFSSGLTWTTSPIALSNGDLVSIGLDCTVISSMSSAISLLGRAHFAAGSTISIGGTQVIFAPEVIVAANLTQFALTAGDRVLQGTATLIAGTTNDIAVFSNGSVLLSEGSIVTSSDSILHVSSNRVSLNGSIALASGDLIVRPLGNMSVVSTPDGSRLMVTGSLYMTGSSTLEVAGVSVTFPVPTVVVSARLPVVANSVVQIGSLSMNMTTCASCSTLNGVVTISSSSVGVVNDTTRITFNSARSVSSATVSLATNDRVAMDGSTMILVSSTGSSVSAAGVPTFGATSQVQLGGNTYTFNTANTLTGGVFDLNDNDRVVLNSVTVIFSVADSSTVSVAGALVAGATSTLSFPAAAVTFGAASAWSGSAFLAPIGSDVTLNSSTYSFDQIASVRTDGTILLPSATTISKTGIASIKYNSAVVLGATGLVSVTAGQTIVVAGVSMAVSSTAVVSYSTNTMSFAAAAPEFSYNSVGYRFGSSLTIALGDMSFNRSAGQSVVVNTRVYTFPSGFVSAQLNANGSMQMPVNTIVTMNSVSFEFANSATILAAGGIPIDAGSDVTFNGAVYGFATAATATISGTITLGAGASYTVNGNSIVLAAANTLLSTGTVNLPVNAQISLNDIVYFVTAASSWRQGSGLVIPVRQGFKVGDLGNLPYTFSSGLSLNGVNATIPTGSNVSYNSINTTFGSGSTFLPADGTATIPASGTMTLGGTVFTLLSVSIFDFATSSVTITANDEFMIGSRRLSYSADVSLSSAGVTSIAGNTEATLNISMVDYSYQFSDDTTMTAAGIVRVNTNSTITFNSFTPGLDILFTLGYGNFSTGNYVNASSGSTITCNSITYGFGQRSRIQSDANVPLSSNSTVTMDGITYVIGTTATVNLATGELELPVNARLTIGPNVFTFASAGAFFSNGTRNIQANESLTVNGVPYTYTSNVVLYYNGTVTIGAGGSLSTEGGSAVTFADGGTMEDGQVQMPNGSTLSFGSQTLQKASFAAQAVESYLFSGSASFDVITERTSIPAWTTVTSNSTGNIYYNGPVVAYIYPNSTLLTPVQLYIEDTVSENSGTNTAYTSFTFT